MATGEVATTTERNSRTQQQNATTEQTKHFNLYLAELLYIIFYFIAYTATLDRESAEAYQIFDK
jgi:hypothetical protein